MRKIKEFCETNGIKTAFFSAIGATDDCILSFYDKDKKEYIGHPFNEPHEITSLLGDVSILENNIIIHAHATISGPDMIAKAGHVKKIIISVTCEMVLEVFEGKIERKSYPEKNLCLIN